MNPEEDKDALWELLGKAKTPSVSPFFARNVLRQIRVSPHPGLFGWLVRHWRLASVGVAALIVAAGLSLNFVRPSEKTYPSDIAQLVANNPDYDVIVHLDELLAYEESALWLDGLPE